MCGYDGKMCVIKFLYEQMFQHDTHSDLEPEVTQWHFFDASTKF